MDRDRLTDEIRDRELDEAAAEIPDEEGADDSRNRFLFAADIARMRGVSRTTAFRWLRAVEKEHGPTVVGRIGNRRYVTRASMMTIAPADTDPDIDIRRGLRKVKLLAARAVQMEMRVKALETAQREAATRERALRGELAELGAVVHVLRQCIGLDPKDPRIVAAVKTARLHPVASRCSDTP